MLGCPPNLRTERVLLKSLDGGEPRPVDKQLGRGEAVSVSPDGSQVLVQWGDDTTASHHITWLDVHSSLPKIIGDSADQFLGRHAWSAHGSRWLSRKSGVGFLLHGQGGKTKLLQAPPEYLTWRGGTGKPYLANQWPAAAGDAAYALVNNGRLYACSAKAAKLVSTVPFHTAGGPPKIGLYESDSASTAAFALSGNELARVDLETGRSEVKDLSLVLPDLVVGRAVRSVYALTDDVVALSVGTGPSIGELLRTDAKQVQLPVTRVYVLRYSDLHACRVVETHAVLMFGFAGLGLAATSTDLWALWLDKHDKVTLKHYRVGM